MTKEEANKLLTTIKLLLIANGKIYISNDDRSKVSEAFDMTTSDLSADVRPNIHGHWIRHLRNDLGVKLNDCIECSECKTWFTTEELLRRSFCPNCGADLRGDKAE